jgi:hypothetical protein
MMRDRSDEPWMPSRAEMEEMIAAQAQFEEDALREGRVTLLALCAARFLPGVTEVPLYTGRTLGLVNWRIFPRQRRGGTREERS